LWLYFVILRLIAWQPCAACSLKQEKDGDIKHTIKARAFACVMLFLRPDRYLRRRRTG